MNKKGMNKKGRDGPFLPFLLSPLPLKDGYGLLVGESVQLRGKGSFQ